MKLKNLNTNNCSPFQFILKWGFFCLLLFVQFISYSQSKRDKLLHIRNADSLVYDVSISKYKKLIGNVLIEHDGTLMRCDSAYVQEDSSYFRGFSNVFVKQGDSIKAYGDEIIYQGNSSDAELIGNARLFKGDSKVYSERLFFNQKAETSYWLNGGKIIQDGSILTSNKGYYNSKSDYFTFRDSVVLIDEDYNIFSDTLGYDPKSKNAEMFGPTTIISEGDTIYTESGYFSNQTQIGRFKTNVKIFSADQHMFADSVYFDQKDSIGHAIGNVRIWDKNENLWIYGEDAFQNHKTKKGLVKGKPLMIQVFEDDSMFMHADTFKVEEIKSHKNIFAYPGVRFFKEDMQGVCDSMHFSFADSLIKMHGDPVLWTESNQLTGDTILMLTYDQEIKNLFINSNSFMIEEIDTTRYNQIKGKRMVGFFKANEITKLDVNGNGETIYWAQDSKNEIIGVNKTECSNIRIRMKDRSIESITFLNKPSSSFSPPKDSSPEKLLLKNFVWKKDLRPKNKEDVLR